MVSNNDKAVRRLGLPWKTLYVCIQRLYTAFVYIVSACSFRSAMLGFCVYIYNFAFHGEYPSEFDITIGRVDC